MKRLPSVILTLFVCLMTNATVAVYQVKDRLTLTVSNAPANSEYEFEQTGAQKERMTAGTATKLHLTGYGNSEILAVSLSMKSNKSSGSGWLRMTIGDQTVWTIDNQSFSSGGWYGNFTTNYVEISKMLYLEDIPQADEINLYIESTENSIYLNKISIVYSGGESNKDDDQQGTDTTDITTTDTTHFTVNFVANVPTFDDYSTKVENGTIINLPRNNYKDNYWSFFGWSTTIYDSIFTLSPFTFPANYAYEVTENTTFYAVYWHKSAPTITEQYTDAEYIIALHTIQADYMLSLKNETILLNSLQNEPTYNTDYLFHFKFLTDSTLYITKNNKYLQYQNQSVYLQSTPFSWNYAIDSNNHLHLYVSGKEEGELYYDYSEDFFRLIDSNYQSVQYFYLYEIPQDIGTKYFTLYPTKKQDALKTTQSLDFITITNNTIFNPEQLEICIYNINGQIVLLSNDETIDIHNLRHGIYIIRSNNKAMKFIKR